jgi:hypothetical protein
MWNSLFGHVATSEKWLHVCVCVVHVSVSLYAWPLLSYCGPAFNSLSLPFNTYLVDAINLTVIPQDDAVNARDVQMMILKHRLAASQTAEGKGAIQKEIDDLTAVCMCFERVGYLWRSILFCSFF